MKNFADRVISTGAQSALGVIGATAIVTGVDWKVVGLTAAMAMAVTVLKVIAQNGIFGTVDETVDEEEEEEDNEQ